MGGCLIGWKAQSAAKARAPSATAFEGSCWATQSVPARRVNKSNDRRVRPLPTRNASEGARTALSASLLLADATRAQGSPRSEFCFPKPLALSIRPSPLQKRQRTGAVQGAGARAATLRGSWSQCMPKNEKPALRANVASWEKGAIHVRRVPPACMPEELRFFEGFIISNHPSSEGATVSIDKDKFTAV